LNQTSLLIDYGIKTMFGDFPMIRLAFTLIEMMIVIGIIALLIGILLPIIARSQREAKSAACKSQLRSIGAAFQNYLNNSHDCYPAAAAFPSKPSNGQLGIVDFLKPYNGQELNAYHCPADMQMFDQTGISYIYNAELGQLPLALTKSYTNTRSSSGVRVLWDADRFHDSPTPYNCLFADGHVDGFQTP
jgi:prepilin-type N-terminal cleavage/methylation domain-containing protein/prepilin-type processing-associated H-X9-DG protein